MSECDTPAVVDKDSSSNTRSKFNMEGVEWSYAKDLSVSLSKFSESSLSRMIDRMDGSTYTQKFMKRAKPSESPDAVEA